MEGVVTCAVSRCARPVFFWKVSTRDCLGEWGKEEVFLGGESDSVDSGKVGVGGSEWD